ncbi:NAD(P)-dependent oxidoreductase [Nocardia sp. NPDC127526]|uniref:NAD(P)-dependent oxidoreductase n=1 Tax=Nocardia sp. NPDC127526 TaxID=3345393 RepID=UPI003633F24D
MNRERDSMISRRSVLCCAAGIGVVAVVTADPVESLISDRKRKDGQVTVPVTVLGLDAVGSAIAGAFAALGHQVSVWDENSAAEPPRGVERAETVEAAMRAGQLIVMSVPNYDSIRRLLNGVGEQRPGVCLIDIVSGTSTDAEEAAALAEQRGLDYLNAAVLVSPGEFENAATRAEALILYSGGSESTYRAHESTLSALAGRSRYLGPDPAIASVYNLALLNMMWGTLNGYLYSQSLLESAGVNAAEFIPLATGWISALSHVIEDFAADIDTGTFPPTHGEVFFHLNSIEHVLQEGHRRGIEPSLPAHFHRLAVAAMDSGRSDDGYASLIEQFRAQ